MLGLLGEEAHTMTDVCNQTVEQMRAFVRAQRYTPLTDDEIARSRKGLEEGAHSSAIEGNPFNATDWAIFAMFDEERATHDVRRAALRLPYMPEAFNNRVPDTRAA
jgi:hypothetical protein